MPGKKSTVKNRKQYEALKDEGMSKERAARIANSKDASKHGEHRSGSGGNAKQRNDRAAQGRRSQGGQGRRPEAQL